MGKQVVDALAKMKEEAERNLQLKCDELGCLLRQGLEEEGRVRADWIEILRSTVEQQGQQAGETLRELTIFQQDVEKEKSVRADRVRTLEEAIDQHKTQMCTIEASIDELHLLTGEKRSAHGDQMSAHEITMSAMKLRRDF